MLRFQFRLLLYIFCFYPLAVMGQILAPNADFSDSTEYEIESQDIVYVFNVDNEDAYIIADTANYPGYTLAWEKFAIGSGFQAPFYTGARIDLDTIPASQGYKLILSSSTDTLQAICWVAFNDFTVEILTKDSDGVITTDALTSRDCVWIGYIEMDYSPRPLIYYNPSSLDTLVYELEQSFSYVTDPEPETSFGILKDEEELNAGRLRFGINNSWWEDAEYTITITDEAGLSREDDILVTAIRPYISDNNTEHIQLNNPDYYPGKDTLYYRAYSDEYHNQGGDDGTKSAPGYYLFTTVSHNFDSLIWSFGDSSKAVVVNDSMLHEYTHWGTYTMKVQAVNYFDYRRECFSNMIEDDEVSLTEPSFTNNDESENLNKVQNVFSPPNGGNPIWRYSDVSISFAEIAIYNRLGRRVHYFKGNIRDWGGWDGTSNNSSNYVTTGVYFYVLKDYSLAPAWNGQEVDIDRSVSEGSVKKGTIHVFNTE